MNKKRPKKWKRIGRCQPNKCGAYCCRVGPEASGFPNEPRISNKLYKLFGWKCEKLKTEKEGIRYIMHPNTSCLNLKGNRCSIQKKKPNICKKFPENPSQAWYQLAKQHGCTYRFVKVIKSTRKN